MKIIKRLFPCLQSSPKQMQRVPPLRKKALLIGIQNIRQGTTVDITKEKYEREAKEDVHIAPAKPKKKKAQKDRNKKKVPKAPELRGPHREVLEMEQLLIKVYHYDPKDITVLIDDDHPDHIQPTKDDMIRKMIELVDGALAGDRLFFHYSGHAIQEVSVNPEEEEENRSDNFLISSDGKAIKFDHLKNLLVESLPIGASLVAIFDSSHSSCSLLDLKQLHCNRVYIPWLNKGRRKSDLAPNIKITVPHNTKIDVSLRSGTQAKRLSHNAITWKRTSIDQDLSSPDSSSSITLDCADMSLTGTKLKKSPSISTDNTEKESWYGSTISPTNRCGSPEPMYCTGNCCDNLSESEKADVISLCSLKNCPRAWGGPDGLPMTQVLIKVLSMFDCIL